MLNISCAGSGYLVYFQPFRCNPLLKCAPQPKIAIKITKTPYFSASRSLKVIDVDILERLVSSACYDKPYVCVYPICRRCT